MNTNRVKLNAEQEQAADHFIGACYVSARPGSGKTRVIVERIIRLIEKGVPARSILALTFTNKAANEMKERVRKILGDAADEIYISTFHALAANVLRKIGGSIGYGGKMIIYDSDDQVSFMAQVARQKGFEISKDDIAQIVWKVNDLRENLTPEGEILENFDQHWEGSIALEYLERMRSLGAVDFTGLLYEMVRLLESDETSANKLRNRFQFLLIDETQDTNLAQFRIANLIGTNGNIFIVADPDQSIYSWRGARYQNIKDFINNHKPRLLSLPLNYRSTPEIVSTASQLINHNSGRSPDDKFITENKSGEPVRCYALPTPEQEGRWIAWKIKQYLEDGYKPEEVAILYRLNSMSRAIEAGLIQESVPYQIIGGHGFYDRLEVRDSLAMLRFLINPYDGIALSRFINKPKRGIGEGILGKIEAFAQAEKIDLVQAMLRVSECTNSMSVKQHCEDIAKVFQKDFSDKSIGEVMTDVVTNLQYDEFLKTDKNTAETYEDRKDNLQELINSAAMYSEERSSDIAAYLNNIALTTSADKKAETGCVSLMTIHASKGLEFPIVFLPCMEDDKLPHIKAVQERPEGLEEERRLCYVGITRGEKIAICSFPKKRMMKYGRGGVQFVHTKPSRFLAECGLMDTIQNIQPIM